MATQALIHLNFSTEKQLKVVMEALEPETSSPPSPRFRVHIKGEGTNLTLNFKARDTSSLRASTNSYLRQINSILDILQLVEGL
jgi:KEOPS complex subunit Pcc1